MNCCRLTRHLVNGPQRFSSVSFHGRYRPVNQTLIHNTGSVRSYYNGCRLLESFRTRLRKGLQRHGTAVWHACSNQAQYVAGHRVWRGQQTGIFHIKLWGSGAFTGLVSGLLSYLYMRVATLMCRSIKSKGNRFLLSCSGAFVYDWQKNKIPDEELTKYFEEVEAALCLKRRTFDINCPTVTSFCTCDGGKANHSQFEREADAWSSFLELPHLLVWKREVPNHRGDGLFEYKVYGKYTDVTALDFMAVNVNTMFRKMWDSGAVTLELLESNSATKSDVIYWEVAWPRIMNNRDYVYLRRYMIDDDKKVIVIINQNTTHPQVPMYPTKERITEYWSIIVIKPITELNKPGIEFTMTYFDNPGANVPASITSWASATAFPEFHKKLHVAAKEYSSKRKEIEAFAKSENAKGCSVKTSKKSADGKDEGLGLGRGPSYEEEQTQVLEQECREEEKEKLEKQRKKTTEIGILTPSGCVIRRKSDYLHSRLSKVMP